MPASVKSDNPDAFLYQKRIFGQRNQRFCSLYWDSDIKLNPNSSCWCGGQISFYALSSIFLPPFLARNVLCLPRRGFPTDRICYRCRGLRNWLHIADRCGVITLNRRQPTHRTLTIRTDVGPPSPSQRREVKSPGFFSSYLRTEPNNMQVPYRRQLHVSWGIPDPIPLIL